MARAILRIFPAYVLGHQNNRPLEAHRISQPSFEWLWADIWPVTARRQLKTQNFVFAEFRNLTVNELRVGEPSALCNLT